MNQKTGRFTLLKKQTLIKMKLKKEFALYIISGVLTTIVNILVYFLFVNLQVNYLVSNVLAWFFSVLFAYVTNRIWVFESGKGNVLKEASLFYGGRIFSGIVDTGLMYLFIGILSIGDFTSKIIIQVIVVILNYVFSKLIVFKK